jgi:hypothetical protein
MLGAYGGSLYCIRDIERQVRNAEKALKNASMNLTYALLEPP